MALMFCVCMARDLTIPTIINTILDHVRSRGFEIKSSPYQFGDLPCRSVDIRRSGTIRKMLIEVPLVVIELPLTPDTVDFLEIDLTTPTAIQRLDASLDMAFSVNRSLVSRSLPL